MAAPFSSISRTCSAMVSSHEHPALDDLERRTILNDRILCERHLAGGADPRLILLGLVLVDVALEALHQMPTTLLTVAE